MAQRKHRELNVGKYERELDEEKDTDYLEQFSHCPACNQECDVTLILPCSHSICGRCITAGERTISDQSLCRGVDLSACFVLCPRCRRPVELPCWTWSSATSCLPHHPALSPACLCEERGAKEGTSEDPLQHVQGNTYCRDTAEEPARSSLHGFSFASPPTTPVDGVVDLQEEEMIQSVFGLCFALDPSSLPPSLHLSSSSLTVSYQGERPSPTEASDPEVPLPFLQVWADVVIARGQYYWEVDVCNSYMYRIGVISLDGCDGWWLERQGLSFCAVYDGSVEPLCTVPPQIKIVGVFLNTGGGALSFHNTLTQEHLATLPTRFSSAGVLPALGLGQGRLKMRCGLPPPPYVFLSKQSTYRRPCGAGRGRWYREIPFQSVRKVIQKFEELAVSDSDSSIVSSFGSSCSTSGSVPDLGIPGTLPSVQAGQETGIE
ncbi:E3 ubiquitin-protein ligase Midline-1 [Channa argus]|uniref:E3 ubiquitin-protein ligase Midline-1 n=1 Tax=Channa argus TaxID=215402 RepID=A0A6G1PS38_CHAAH|nr:E3 ubiquitin-protein ligase Midline-1 [Channa argus]